MEKKEVKIRKIDNGFIVFIVGDNSNSNEIFFDNFGEVNAFINKIFLHNLKEENYFK